MTAHLGSPQSRASPPRRPDHVDLSTYRGSRLDRGPSDRTSPTTIGHGEVAELFTETVAYWKQWLARGTYRSRWREAVQRSAMALKLMTYAPTGGLVAAPTAGLPEQVGGERNWDYRSTWVRDASFSIYALLGLGFTDEAAGPSAASVRGHEQRQGDRRERLGERGPQHDETEDEPHVVGLPDRADGVVDERSGTFPAASAACDEVPESCAAIPRRWRPDRSARAHA